MKYILYCRKSQESEDRQVQSLEAQERELRERASYLGINIVAIYHESKSAKTVGRPVFNEVVKQIQKGKAEGLLCWKLDRLARNFIDGGLIIDLLQRGVLKSIHTFEKEYLPSDNVLMMAVELGMANQYSRDLSENVKRGNREKIIKGGWPGHAPFGYLNNKADKTLYIDPVRGKYVKMMYELYSTGRYSLKGLSNELYEQGLRTNAGNKVHCGTIRHIMRNPIYHGVIRYRGGYYPAKFESITPKDLYDACMSVMDGNSKPRRQKHNFPLVGLFTCGVCGCAVTAERHKTYSYYHCTNGKGICNQKKLFLRQEALDDQIAELFDQIAFDEELIEMMYLSALEKMKHEDTFNTKSIDDAEMEIASIKVREDRLLEAYLAGNIEKDIYDERRSELKLARLGTEKNLANLRKNLKDPYATIELTKELFLFSNRAKSEYKESVPEKKREIAFEVLSNSLLIDKIMAQPQLKSPYDMLARTPKNADFSTLCG
jgi:site-specific DNA recombinase